MTSEARRCLDEVKRHRLDEGPTIVRQAVRMTLEQVVDDLKRATERLNEKSRSKGKAA